jgi:hypothetical protein
MPEQVPVRVRMYRYGLGDCILVTFHPDHKPFHMLFDCGLYKIAERPEEKMQAVVAQIRDATKPRPDSRKGHLHALVVTHEHWDHASGFAQAQQLWEKEIEVDELWMAWTEDPSIPLARALREERVRGVRALTEFLQGKTPDELNKIMTEQELSTFRTLLSSFGPTPLRAAQINDMTAAGAAIDIIKQRTRAIYHRPGTTIMRAALPGVRFHVLGPPQNQLIFKEGKDRQDGTIYEFGFHTDAARALFVAAGVQQNTPTEAERFMPFPRELRISPKTADNRNYFERTYFRGRENWRSIETDWLRASTGLALNLAGDTNNTSMVLAIELISTGDVLLFTGDAQVGNWLSWRNLPWPTDALNPQAELTWSEDLLRRTVFYKVGHHGSENATLKDNGLMRMSNDKLVAMIPLDMEVASQIWKTKKWPHPPLLRELLSRTRGRVIVADPASTLPSKEYWMQMEKNLPNQEKHPRDKVLKAQGAAFKVADTHIDYETQG